MQVWNLISVVILISLCAVAIYLVRSLRLVVNSISTLQNVFKATALTTDSFMPSMHCIILGNKKKGPSLQYTYYLQL